MATKRKSKGAYMISSVAEMYGIHPQTLRLYEREGLLKPSRTEGNTRLYTEEDLERLEFILNLARDLGVNIAGIAIVSADARAHGRNESPDAELRRLCAHRNADARSSGRCLGGARPGADASPGDCPGATTRFQEAFLSRQSRQGSCHAVRER